MGSTSNTRSRDNPSRGPRRPIRGHGESTQSLAVLEALNLPVSLITPQYTYRWVNSCYAATHGKHPEEIIGRPVSDLWGEQTFNNAIKGKLDRCFAGTEVRDEGWVSFQALGRRYCEIVYSPYRPDDGLVRSAMVITYDITDRKEMEERLAESEQRFRDLSEASLEAIVFMENGVIVDANQALSRMFGYTLDEARGKLATEFIAPDRRAYTEGQIRTLAEGAYETTGIRKDGSLFPIEVNPKELAFRGRNLRVSAVRDLTEQKRIESELRAHQEHLEHLVEERTGELKKSEEKFRNIFENATEGVFQIAPGGRCLSINPAFARIHGYATPEDFVTEVTDIERVHVEPEQRRKYIALLHKEDRVRDFEFKVYRRDKSVTWVSVNGRAVRDETGAVLYHEGTVQDISQRKEAEEYMLLQHDLALKLAGTSSLEEALLLCLDTGMKVSRMESGGIYIKNRQTGNLELACSAGLSKTYEREVALVDAQSAAYAVVMAGKPVYRSPREDTTAPFRTEVLEEGFISTAAIPVLHNGEAIACFNLASRTLGSVPLYGHPALELIATQLGTIFARIQAEHELQEREEHFSLMFKSSPGAMLLTTLDGRCVDVNQSFLKIVGYAREEVVGKTTGELELWLSRERREKTVRKVRRHGSLRDYETYIRTKSGELRDILVSVELIERRGETYILTMFHDITERKRAEAQLLAQRDLALQLAGTSSLDGALSLCLERAMQVSGMDCGGIHLRNPDTDDLEMAIHKGLSEAFVRRFSLFKAHSKVWSLSTQRREVAFSLTEDVNKAVRQPILQEGLRSVIMAPVFYKGRVLACMHLGSHQGISGISASPTLDLIASQIGAILVRVRAEQELEKDIEKRKEAEEALEAKSRGLEEANAALKVLLKRREDDRKELEDRLVSNVKQLVLPHVEKLKKGRIEPSLRPAVEFVEANVKEILSPFLNNLRRFNFSPRQLEIIALIKEGKTTKDIAEFLHLSKDTIDKQRFLIRKKLDINKEKANLRSFLLSLA